MTVAYIPTKFRTTPKFDKKTLDYLSAKHAQAYHIDMFAYCMKIGESLLAMHHQLLYLAARDEAEAMWRGMDRAQFYNYLKVLDLVGGA